VSCISLSVPMTIFLYLRAQNALSLITVKPDHKWYLVVFFDGVFYIDHNVPFGLTSASGLQGEVADATVDIWEHHGVSPAVKWVDDFNVFRFPKTDGHFHGISDGVEHMYDYDLTSIKSLIAPLGIPWHKTKGQEFSDTFTYLGFHWDIPSKSVSLPNLKHEKYLCKLSLFISACEHAQVSKAHAESIIGTLSHITFVYRRGRSYMSNLYKWLTSFLNDYIPRWITSSALTDLRWWFTLLSQNHAPRSLAPGDPTCDYNIWVDASMEWGIGLLWGTQWATWQLLDGWRGPSRDIGWLEGVAVELAILATRAMGIRNADILIRSDNEGVIGAFSKGRCSNFMTNLSIRRSDEVYNDVGISVRARPCWN
jgi:hypothetical protein